LQFAYTDDSETINNTLDVLLDKPDQIKQMMEMSRIMGTNYLWENAAKNYCLLYEKKISQS
jgi:glycosyltransferase involved in cell wall biosynthesis